MPLLWRSLRSALSAAIGGNGPERPYRRLVWRQASHRLVPGRRPL